jgi:predicted hydrocarbon binding protein
MSPSVPALIPLALLEAVQNIDTPPDDGLGALADELAAKRLGLSRTVAAQVARYRSVAAGGGSVTFDEAAGVVRLVGRRPDAALVYADAGRRAARYTAQHQRLASRLAIRAAPRRLAVALGLRSARALSARWLGLVLCRADGGVRVEVDQSLALAGREDGGACGFYTAAVAEVLRQVARLEWAVQHESCRGHGAERCVWRGGRAGEYE